MHWWLSVVVDNVICIYACVLGCVQQSAFMSETKMFMLDMELNIDQQLTLWEGENISGSTLSLHLDCLSYETKKTNICLHRQNTSFLYYYSKQASYNYNLLHFFHRGVILV